MNEIKLVVGALSTWSMRAWMSLKLADIEFEESIIPLGQQGYESMLRIVSATRLVPVLIHDDLKIHDSLAIAEYANEISLKSIFPAAQHERAIARSLCAELHSGFLAIRDNCPFHIEAVKSVNKDQGMELEVARLTQIWEAANGNFYFEKTSVVDAFYSVMAFRLTSYGINLPGKAGDYQNSLIAWQLFQDVLKKTQSWNQTST